jgi:hypothetical protein
MANVHGMAAPFGSPLPMLLGGSSAPPAATLAEVRPRFAAEANPPGLQEITSEYVKFHAVMALEGTIVVAVLIDLTVLVWRGFARAYGRRPRRLLAEYGVFTPLVAVALGVVVVANAMTAAHPAPGLEGFLAGGW